MDLELVRQQIFQPGQEGRDGANNIIFFSFQQVGNQMICNVQNVGKFRKM